jgi:MOSC domain-containing protein YiiM
MKTTATTARVESVNVARPRRVLIGDRLVLTAIHKQAVAAPVAVGTLGLDGDEQADPSVHGGASKAVYLYPQEHRAFWNAERERAARDAGSMLPADGLGPGAMGENLTTSGLTEDMLWIGDELHLPHATFVVSEPRYPCFKFNAAMGYNRAAKAMVQSGYCGAYLAVLATGRVETGDAITLVPGPREVKLLDVFRSKAAA